MYVNDYFDKHVHNTLIDLIPIIRKFIFYIFEHVLLTDNSDRFDKYVDIIVCLFLKMYMLFGW